MGTRLFADISINDLQEKNQLILLLRDEIAYLKKKMEELRQELEYCKEVIAKNDFKEARDRTG
ncbi:MAG: hypothetical protein WC560_09585 [Syntrophales bacterium]